MTTPMRQQYLSLKAQYPGCILFFRLGDFYETFDDDAKIVAQVCDVVLTSKPIGDNLRVPLAGVPYHAVDNYLARLVEAGYKVAVADQMTEPGRGLIEREVTRVVTKGTIVELGMLDAKRNNYLMAVTFDHRGEAGLAYCDITTGEFAATQVTAGGLEEVERRIGEELSRLQPSELIHVDWPPAESTLHSLIATLDPILSTVEPWQTEPTTAAETLKRHFRVASLDGFGLLGKAQAIRAAAALLAYLKEMQPAALAQLTRLHSYETHAFMTLDESTRRNLELTATLRGGDAKGSLLDVLDRTLTPMGGRLLRRRLNQPILDVAAINRRLDTVQQFYDDTQARLTLRERLRSLGDLERWVNRVVQGIALPRDLVGIRDALRRAPEITAELDAGNPATHAVGDGAISSVQSPISNLFPPLPHCGEILTRLESALAEEPPATLATPGMIRPGYSKELDGLLDKSRHAKDWIADLERSERERLDIKSLKVGYNKVFGYYIEITNPHAHKAPDDYIRKQTLTNAERYITPELKEYETLVLNADERRLEIEQEIFRALCNEIATEADALLQLAHGLAELDLFSALAEVALGNRYVRPVVNDGPCIEVQGGRHPVVELTLADEPFVPNDTQLTPDAAIHILTGPNMAGKSTFLRQVALITLMAQIGSFVPADAAQIGVVDRIFTRIGASDEIHRGQSTFMVEMVETANILHHATSRSLLVLDEIGRGTSTYDGLAIAWAVVEYIHNHPGLRAKTLFATHYHELTDLAERLPHVVNYNVAVDDSAHDADGGSADVVFLRRIMPGKADRSYGVHVARMAGLPLAAVHRAEEILHDLERSGAAGPRRLLDLETRRGKPAAMQVSLFAETHPAVEALRKLDVNNLTPLDALNRLYELQKLAQ
ncbi:MAG: DNA mismatch repair protein MutS [Caldilineaceae bacterium]|nr:DNA mismatch repair protein MutS [Caldilineaceae bacterium]